MKRIFKIIGLISLACFSFFITEKTALVVQNVDNIMIQIKDNYSKYEINSKDAKIEGDTIIPGIYGKKVDIKKSYKKMKKFGYYNEDLFVYKKIKPTISIENNLDKYIIRANPENRNISLIFIIKEENKNINNILRIINNNNIKANFFVNDDWFNNNNDLVIELIKNDHIIGNLSHNLDYQDTSFTWMDTIIKNLSKQKRGYCYYTNNIDNLNKCKLLKNYTIKPIEINNNHLSEVKKILENGVIISFEINSKLEKEIDYIIKYIKSKGYDIVNLEKLLSENK